ncbi:MAG: type II toxin-antitoxin system RelB/DinJ family antitoxin [Deltaproteobacteria bacterium]|nr:type II toxin-antitoxin system RelB/DinJ family antitoxin [Deltaproteobacteria bacterium]MCL5966890.1 type II toxin-antitoxin system RelB/DinJ family antitoxin [Deltaproteobacteria bacterium]
MARTATIRARTEPALKADAERIFHKLGMSSSEAINLFYAQVRLRKGLPFAVEIPNEETRRTFEKSDRGKDIKTFRSLGEMFEDLES